MPGVRPGGRPTFLLRNKKVGKEMRPAASVPSAALRGNLRCSGMGCAAELPSRCALRSNSCRESEHEVWSLFGDQTQPLPCAPRRWQKGVGQPNFQRPAGIVLFELDFGVLVSGARSVRASSYQIHREVIKHLRSAQHSPIKKLSRYSGPPPLLPAPRSTGRGLSSCFAESNCHVI